MPSISFHEFSVQWLEPNQSLTTKWNNAPFKRVFAFSAQPVAHQNGAVAKMEVMRSWEEHNFDSGETEVKVTVKNVGSFGGYCYIFMSQVHP